MKRDFLFYWFRAVYSAYLLRPNDAALAAMEPYRTVPVGGDGHARSCVAVYVRHGDKHSEMALLPFSAYVAAADDLWRVGLIHGYRPAGAPLNPLFRPLYLGPSLGPSLGSYRGLYPGPRVGSYPNPFLTMLPPRRQRLDARKHQQRLCQRYRRPCHVARACRGGGCSGHRPPASAPAPCV